MDKVPLVELIELLIPCILHLENQVGEKIINMIIRFGFQKHQQSATDFIAELQEVFCKQGLGSPDCHSQWKIRYTKESDGSIQIEPIQERNTVVHGMLNSIEKVIYGATLDNERGF